MTLLQASPLSSQPRILFMGTPEFAVPSLQALYDWCTQQGGEVVGVVSQPDRPKGRGKRLQRTPVAALSDTLGLTCYQWPRLNQDSFDTLTALKYDLAVVIAYGKILPARYLNLPQFGCINLHASILPAHRGAAPIQWALINGDAETGVSVMKLDEGMDTGPVAHIKTTSIDLSDHAQSLFQRLSTLSAAALTDVLDRWIDPETTQPVVFSPQPTEGVSHAPMLTKADGVLQWEKSSLSLFNLIRGVSAWPGGQTQISEGVLKVHSATSWTEEKLEKYLIEHPELEAAKPGQVLAITKQGPVIRCGEGALLLTKIQRPSKQATSGGDFCRGYPLRLGSLLSDC